MGWSIGHDGRWDRDIGYGVPAICDHPECSKEIDRGLAYVCCGQEAYGGDDGCGLFFCGEHQGDGGKCERCAADEKPFDPSPDTEEWTNHKATDPSWAEWREAQKDA